MGWDKPGLAARGAWSEAARILLALLRGGSPAAVTAVPPLSPLCPSLPSGAAREAFRGLEAQLSPGLFGNSELRVPMALEQSQAWRGSWVAEGEAGVPACTPCVAITAALCVGCQAQSCCCVTGVPPRWLHFFFFFNALGAILAQGAGTGG